VASLIKIIIPTPLLEYLTSNPTTATSTFTGKTNGDFTEIPAGVEILSYQMNFTKPVSLALEYITVANSSDLLNLILNLF
jgi:hypothetical protein